MMSASPNPDNMDTVADQLASAIEELATQLFQRKPISLRRKSYLAALGHSPRKFLAYCALVRALKHQWDFFNSSSSIIIFEIPEHWDVADFYDPAVLCFGDNRKDSEVGIFLHHNAGKPSRGREVDVDVDEYLCRRKLAIFAHDGNKVHPHFLIAANTRLKVQIGLPDDFQALARLMKVGRLTPEQVDVLQNQRSQLLDAIFRYGNPIGPYLDRLSKGAVESTTERKPLPLTDDFGFGEAARWGMQFKKDLSEWRAGRIPWRDVETGVLIFGPPGTGKTQFAISLAHECGIPLIATSLSAWQARGALDDLLKAMYASFAEAKSKAPAILFIDEIDAVGDRQKFTGRNAQYSNQVVNGILEAIDGIQGREGVAVIGATNFPDRIDPALTRNGRLGRHFKIDLPTSNERTKILEYYLPIMTGRPELRHLAKRLRGHSGADIEALARRVNQRARIERRGVSIDDLQVEMPVALALDETSEFQIAIHEAGHAIIAHYFRPGRVARIQLFDPGDPDSEEFGSYGRVTLEHSQSLGTRSSMLEEIAVGLGGLCAEEVVLGDRSVSSGGTDGSDLARVTAIAVAMIAEYGFGPDLFFSQVSVSRNSSNPLTLDMSTKRDVNTILAGQRDLCQAILTNNKSVVLAVGIALMRDKLMTGPALDDLLANVSTIEQLKPR